MTDPYSVLGVSKDASDEEVRNAYRTLARKYHPDKYINNPLADLAGEKMKEINAAYDTIQKMRKEGTSGYYNASSSSSNQSGHTGGHYQQGVPLNDVRRLIMQNRIAEAEELLNGIPISRRDGEWHFLKGTIFYKKGWLNEAYINFQRACQLNPNNMEYRQALSQLSYQRSAGMPYGSNTYNGQSTMMGCSGCNLCTNLICADCCCEMMGGDLLPC